MPPEEGERLPLIGRSPAMQEIYRALARLMSTDLTVMVNGEKIPADAPVVAASGAVHGQWFLARKGGRDIALVKLG